MKASEIVLIMIYFSTFVLVLISFVQLKDLQNKIVNSCLAYREELKKVKEESFFMNDSTKLWRYNWVEDYCGVKKDV